MGDRDKRCLALSFLILAVSIIITLIYIGEGYKATENTALNQAIKEITKSYRLYQIVATVIMYTVGFFVVFPLCDEIGGEWSYLLALPIGNALWGTLSSFVLFVNIPYNKSVMCLLAAFIILSLFLKFRRRYKKIEWRKVFTCNIIVISIAFMASSGLFAIFTSSDSYYFVMQYGELIAKHGKLSSDIVGTYMTWTGITPALTSAYATMWGFENIYAIHYLMIFSMYGFIILAVYKEAIEHCGKKKAIVLSVMAIVTVGIVPGLSYLSMWIIGNAYFMVYIVFLVLLPIVAKENLGYKTLTLMALMMIWLALCRQETGLVVCFIIICFSALGLQRKQMLFLYLPVFIFQLLFFTKIIYEYLQGARQADERLLTFAIMLIILMAFILTACYIGVYNWKILYYIRKHVTFFGLATLLIACIILGVLDIDKFTNNLDSVVHNMADWYWKYIPLTVFLLEILKTYFKCRNKYYDLVIWGFVLCNFAICMGRPQYLRLGIGDSYNRICMSIVPLYIVTTILTFVRNLQMIDHESIKVIE